MTQPIRVLSLFSGIGGFELAMQEVNRGLGFNLFQAHLLCEIDPFCQKVLNLRFPGVPIVADVRAVNPQPGQFDLIVGGFPCQDISCANPNGRGLEGERSGLFFELMRIVRHARPRYVLLENVSAMLTKQSGRIMGTILYELSQSGYDAEWQTISAASMGSPQLRERVFIVAYAQSVRRARDIKTPKRRFEKISVSHWQAAHPEILRVADGLPNRMDRIKSLGNSIVPECAVLPLLRIAELSMVYR